MPKKLAWTQLRVTRATRERLAVFMARLDVALNLGTVEIDQRHNVAITVDAALNVLLDRDERKRERVKEATQRRRQGKARPAAGLPDSQR